MDKEIGDFYFKRTGGERVLLLENCNKAQATAKMQEFLNKNNFKSYYTRIWRQNNTMWFDVGSHTEFFLLVFKDGEDNAV